MSDTVDHTSDPTSDPTSGNPATPTDAAPASEQPSPPSRRNRTPIIAAGALVAMAGAAYLAGHSMTGHSVPKKATVAGVAVGGLSAAEAEAKLRAELAASTTTPVTLTAGSRNATITPDAAGLAVDYAASIARTGAGSSWNPADMWRVLAGGQATDLVVTSDRTKLTAAVTAAAAKLDVAPKNAAVAITGTTPKSTPGTDGTAVDIGKTSDALVAAWPAQRTVSASTATKTPDLTTDEANAVVQQFLTPALAAPITLTAGTQKLTITQAQIAAATTVTSANGTFSASTDVAKLWVAAQPALKKLNFTAPKNASFTFAGGKPAVVPSADGTGITKTSFTNAVTPLTSAPSATRTASVAVTTVPASFTTDAANKAGVQEITGEFTTHFPYAEYRNINLTQAAKGINGVYLAPGETFSLNQVLGPRTRANGYVDGWVIVGDHLEKEEGGGVSQSATTTFNAIFFAGLQDVEHHPHTFWFDRYPQGREATVYYGKLDLRFKNDTKYGVLMQAFVDKAQPGGQGSITVRVWSTKTWDAVKSSELVTSDFYSGTTQHRSGSTCHAQSAALGFAVDYKRLFYQGGKLVKSEPFHWKYSAQDEIICT